MLQRNNGGVIKNRHIGDDCVSFAVFRQLGDAAAQTLMRSARMYLFAVKNNFFRIFSAVDTEYGSEYFASFVAEQTRNAQHLAAAE